MMPTLHKFVVWTRIEQDGRRYRVVGCAMPENAALRCSPPQRIAICKGRAEAEKAASQVAAQLLDELARGGFSAAMGRPPS
jgi:hypothetical protein